MPKFRNKLTQISKLLWVRSSNTIDFVKLFRSYGRDEKAATALEYCLIAAGIALAIIVVVTAIGDEIVNLFEYTQGQFSARQP